MNRKCGDSICISMCFDSRKQSEKRGKNCKCILKPNDEVNGIILEMKLWIFFLPAKEWKRWKKREREMQMYVHKNSISKNKRRKCFFFSPLFFMAGMASYNPNTSIQRYHLCMCVRAWFFSSWMNRNGAIFSHNLFHFLAYLLARVYTSFVELTWLFFSLDLQLCFHFNGLPHFCYICVFVRRCAYYTNMYSIVKSNRFRLSFGV